MFKYFRKYNDKYLMLQEKSIFQCTDYKPYLIQRLGRKHERKGMRSALARALGCQPSFVSQVLNGNLEFNLEQGEAISRFLGHTPDEHHFFMLLVQMARAGTITLRKYFATQVEQILQRRLILTERLEKRTSLSQEHQAVYYSSWIYAAVHIALTIPDLRTKESIAKYLNFPLSKISEVLEFLVQTGLVIVDKNHWRVGESSVRLGNDSHNIRKHHSNWRARALESLDREEFTDFHYSSVFSLSKSDILKVKDVLLSSVEKTANIVKPSEEEELYGICIDFFSLDRSGPR